MIQNKTETDAARECHKAYIQTHTNAHRATCRQTDGQRQMVEKTDNTRDGICVHRKRRGEQMESNRDDGDGGICLCFAINWGGGA